MLNLPKWARHLGLVAICLLALFSVAAARAEWGPDEGTIRGAAFLDMNRNGKMDAGEKGVGWVYFTISQGTYSHTYYSEWREKDEAGNTYATGYYGPAPLKKGWWQITYNVPDGYVATTPTTLGVNVPGKDGGHVAYAYLGLYPSRSGSAKTVAATLPAAGMLLDPIVLGSLAFLGLGGLTSVGLGLRARRKQ